MKRTIIENEILSIEVDTEKREVELFVPQISKAKSDSLYACEKIRYLQDDIHDFKIIINQIEIKLIEFRAKESTEEVKIIIEALEECVWNLKKEIDKRKITQKLIDLFENNYDSKVLDLIVKEIILGDNELYYSDGDDIKDFTSHILWDLGDYYRINSGEYTIIGL